MRTPRRLAGVILAAGVAVLLAAVPAGAQSATLHYVYDPVGRVQAVVDAQGDVGVYQYDSVGNLTGIERVTVSSLPGAVAISLVTPSQGKDGTSVTLFGKGFSATPAQNAVDARRLRLAMTHSYRTFVRSGVSTKPGQVQYESGGG